jgi:pyruvate dehydrogenase E1 component alpha subunit
MEPVKDAAQHSPKGGSPPSFTREQDFAALRNIILLRRFEEKAGQLYGMGMIGGFCHLYIGQETVVVGIQMALKEGDQVITRSVTTAICSLAAWTPRASWRS